jgi:nicotinamidase-related amidase
VTPDLDPARTALVVFECQEGIVGTDSVLPGLAAAVREGDVLSNIARLADAARASGVPVVYCTFERGARSTMNTPLEIRMRAGGHAPPSMGPIVAELAPADGDVVIARSEGLTGFHGTGLDDALGPSRTIVLTGVSVNIGILGTAIEAVNHGYTVVVPTDCVAGDPPDYAEAALRYSLRNLAFLSTSTDIADAWSG